jgi:hypothetical protein
MSTEDPVREPDCGATFAGGCLLQASRVGKVTKKPGWVATGMSSNIERCDVSPPPMSFAVGRRFSTNHGLVIAAGDDLRWSWANGGTGHASIRLISEVIS